MLFTSKSTSGYVKKLAFDTEEEKKPRGKTLFYLFVLLIYEHVFITAVKCCACIYAL